MEHSPRADHGIFEVGVLGQRPENAIESISIDPSAEPLEDRVPLAELIWQLTLLRTGAHNPQNRFHKQPGVTPSLPRIGGLPKAIRPDCRPPDIIQNSAGQGCSPLFATLNQKSGDLGVLNVNSP
jgi:hypothetical protein